LAAQSLLHEKLKNSIKTLVEVEEMMKSMEINLQQSNEYIVKLKQENLNLKLSCDIWINRAIEFQLKFLRASDATKK
jgi:hypothetical protein